MLLVIVPDADNQSDFYFSFFSHEFVFECLKLRSNPLLREAGLAPVVYSALGDIKCFFFRLFRSSSLLWTDEHL